MVEGGCRLCFLHESQFPPWVRNLIRWQEFQSDKTIKVGVAGYIDNAHAVERPGSTPEGVSCLPALARSVAALKGTGVSFPLPARGPVDSLQGEANAVYRPEPNHFSAR